MFYFFPYADDEREVPFTPWATYGLIAACVALFLAQLLLPGPLEEIGGLYPGRLFGYVPQPSETRSLPPWATLFAHAFLHADLLHLGGNMLYLWIFGDNVEQRLGHVGYLAVFLAFGALAGWTHALIYPLQGGLIGASGAISGLLGVYLVCRPRSSVHFVLGFLVWYRNVKIPAWITILVWMVIQGLSLSVQTLGEADNVAYLAHLAGFIAGIPVGIVLRWRQAAHAPMGH